MLTRSQRIQGVLVVILGLTAALATPRALQAGEAYVIREACSWNCPTDGCAGQWCEEESCWDNENNERPWTIGCAA